MKRCLKKKNVARICCVQGWLFYQQLQYALTSRHVFIGSHLQGLIKLWPRLQRYRNQTPPEDLPKAGVSVWKIKQNLFHVLLLAINLSFILIHRQIPATAKIISCLVLSNENARKTFHRFARATCVSVREL